MQTRPVPWSWVTPGSTVVGPSGRARLVLAMTPGVAILASPVQAVPVGPDEMTNLAEASEVEAMVAILVAFPASQVIETVEA